MASALYHNWLVELATQTKLADVTITPGHVEPRADLTNVKFTPLLTASRQSSILRRAQVMQRDPFGRGAQLSPRR